MLSKSENGRGARARARALAWSALKHPWKFFSTFRLPAMQQEQPEQQEQQEQQEQEEEQEDDHLLALPCSSQWLIHKQSGWTHAQQQYQHDIDELINRTRDIDLQHDSLDELEDALAQRFSVAEEAEESELVLEALFDSLLVDLVRESVDVHKKLAPLAAEELNKARQMWNWSPTRAVISKFNVDLNASHITCLRDGVWLNDEVMNFHIEMMTERLKNRTKADAAHLPRVFFHNSFFFTKLCQDGYNYRGVRRWTKRKKVDIFSKDLVLFPVHVGESHWCLGVVNFADKKLQYYDSLGGDNRTFFTNVRRYVVDEYADKKGGGVFDMSNWSDECVRDIPRQMNGCDCGVFATKFADYVSEGVPLVFAQKDMRYFRRRMTLEILHGEIL